MYYRNEPDETLVMLTLAGEQTAYETLVTRYQSAVVASAMAVTKNRFMAEDAAQDAFVSAWMKLNTLSDPKKYSSWVCRIARNCAVNMIKRYRSFLPLDVVENVDIRDDSTQSPLQILERDEEKRSVNEGVERLPDRVRTVIRLHYFEGLSIAEIADRMRISEGTVKWQLHDGRRRLRKELCAMNEKYGDTLVERVMKKVEELKLWQLKNDKSGFEEVYRSVLSEVETLPECVEKQHALADVLMRGWWWIPGKKNDALFARIADAAIEGKNEEVMTFIVAREDSNVYGYDEYGAKAEFIRDKQIPRLERAGFTKPLGREWFWLGYYLFRRGNTEEALEAYARAEEILSRGDAYYELVPYARKMEEMLSTELKDKSAKRYSIGATAEEYRFIGNELHYWSSEGFGEGWTQSIDREVMNVYRNSSRCDGRFFADIGVGETFVGSDGTTLTFVSDSETVNTPAGCFENCQLWEIKCFDDLGKSVFLSYYKDGIGIVKHIHNNDGILEARYLASYKVRGGGLLPFSEGNTWEYASEYDKEAVYAEASFKVSYADGERIILSSWESVERKSYDECSWLEMINQVRCDYSEDMNGNHYICDVSHAIERAELLAKTPMERAHTKAAASVARRIMATDPTFNPDRVADGLWNFFNRHVVKRKKNTLYMAYNGRWSFEWKHASGENNEYGVLHNDIYGILQDATNCIWSDDWRVAEEPIVEYNEYVKWSHDVKTKIVCSDGGTVTTKAGSFDDCLKVELDISGMDGGWDYRGGKKTYYFAEGIGIVRTENEYCGGARVAVYELTSYKGVGKGFMPLEDGFVRRYDGIGFTDGMVGAAEYTYAADDDGDIIIFDDRTGIRNHLPDITRYDSVCGEVVEDRLWDEGKHDESRLIHDLNNFHLLCHFLGRPSRYWAAPEKAVAWNKYRLKLLEGLGDGEVPDAWLGLYASTSFRTACALFGIGKKEEGYEWLEIAFEAFPKWESIAEGTEMEVGDPLIYGGVKVIKGISCVLLPDGRREPIFNEYMFEDTSYLMYYGLTAKHGWEWFNSVRDEERFKQYVKRAERLVGKN
ncbi:MAG: sigma-70 family RNA polymerase sigma factor [Clostridia bacterium]|nr:sigma-70 family RNA polymerase sigma factor [Clostridia bacterium]